MSVHFNDYKGAVTIKLNQFLQELEHQYKKQDYLSILIFTNFGQIECTLASPENSENDPIAVIFSGAVKLAKLNDLPALHIKNAKITPYGSKEAAHIVEDMILFTDQIVGLSFR
ncbi:hypothetical protein ACE3MS_31145 [Paenibacillus dendritiformis]|uniref:hypothetical protein n=1 Tax=Paenibacillus dendritiformis TaxID=130049 RepID=UPI00365DF5C9